MGQKVHPYGFRLGYNKNWLSRWFSKKDYPGFVLEDDKIRKYAKKVLFHAGISKIEIERAGGKVRIIVHTARPGIVIGRKGVEIEKIRDNMRKKFGREIAIEVVEIRRPETDAQLVAESIATQLERRVAFRRAMKRTVGIARKFGAEGIKVAWPEPRSPAASGIATAACPCRPSARTWTSALPRPRPRMASLASRSGFSRVRFWMRWNNNARSQETEIS